MELLKRRKLTYCKTNWSWVESQRDDDRYTSDDQRASSRLIQSQREYHQRLEEPAPDYSPPSPRATPSPHPHTPPPEGKKKVYQRTRFAADIPPARTKAAQGTQTPHKTSLGESFRKFVGKFRSSSKEKRRGKKGSRSPSPQGHTYQQYNVVDNLPGEGGDGPVAPPRLGRHRDSGTQTPGMRRAGDPVVTRYYLGEDPFGGSIYGREREYDGVTPYRRRQRRGSEDDRNARESVTELFNYITRVIVSILVNSFMAIVVIVLDNQNIAYLPLKLGSPASILQVSPRSGGGGLRLMIAHFLADRAECVVSGSLRSGAWAAPAQSPNSNSLAVGLLDLSPTLQDEMTASSRVNVKEEIFATRTT
ncbi:hypothetical protein J6590_086255 [Homalodisca vitripennis]|nr:hypothetical protein J6590_086255 [Homalodisca vitripennis]